MQQNDDVVSGWLNGDDRAGGFDNPAGALYVDNAIEQKMTQAGAQMIDTQLKTTQSCASGCACC